jgi:periplasmic protein TonB
LTDPADAAGPPRVLTLPIWEERSRVLPVAVLVALFLHLSLIFTVTFKMPERRIHPTDSTLEVLILKQTGETTDRPEPDAALSQRSRVGESPRGAAAVSTEDRPGPLPPDDTDDGEALDEEPAPPPPPPPPARQRRHEVLTAPPKPKAERKVTRPTAAPPDILLDAAPAPVDAARILASRDQEIARLTESLQERSLAYANRARRKSISASTREFRYASYLGAWERKVERIGNLNYPQAAKDQGLYGNLILHVAVRADGSIETIRVVRSSGRPLLDEAAKRIVEMAAPYAPFPPEIAAETDVLDIVRTWQFLRAGRLGWEQ